MKVCIIAVATIAILGQSMIASSHPGRLDANGGHNVSGGGYHYHNKVSSTKSDTQSQQRYQTPSATYTPMPTITYTPVPTLKYTPMPTKTPTSKTPIWPLSIKVTNTTATK